MSLCNYKMKKWSEFYDLEFNIKDYLGNLNSHSELFYEIIRQSPQKILELGIGSGIMGIFLSWLGYDVVGLDNDFEIIKKARAVSEKLNGKVKYICADAFQIDNIFGKNKFDVVFNNGLLEHFDDSRIRGIVSKQLEIAKTVIITVPSRYFLGRAFGDERFLDIRDWGKILYDFKPIELRYYTASLPSYRKDILRFIVKPLSFWRFLQGAIIKSRAYILIKINATL